MGLPQVRGQRVLVGTRNWMAEHGLSVPEALGRDMARAERCGHTAVLVAAAVTGGGEHANLVPLGMIAVSDTLRPEAASVLAALQSRGVECWMVTGDNQRTAAHVAAQCGLDAERVLAGTKPEGKVAKVAELQQRHGLVVAMVGDVLRRHSNRPQQSPQVVLTSCVRSPVLAGGQRRLRARTGGPAIA